MVRANGAFWRQKFKRLNSGGRAEQPAIRAIVEAGRDFDERGKAIVFDRDRAVLVAA